MLFRVFDEIVYRRQNGKVKGPTNARVQGSQKEELGDEWLRRENDRVKGYFVHAAELSKEKRGYKRELNKKYCATYRKRQKLQKGSINQYEAEPQASTLTCDDNGVSSTTGNISLVVQFPLQSESRQSRGTKRITNALAIQYRKQETLRSENSLLKRKLNTTRRSLKRLKQRNGKVKEAEHGTPKSIWETQQLLKKKARTREDFHGVRKSNEKLRLNMCNKDNDQKRHQNTNADEEMPTSGSKNQDNVSRICDNDEQLNRDDNKSGIVDISVGAASKHDVKCNADEFVVIVYDDKRYIGQVVDIDNEDGEYEVSYKHG